jgi:tripartite-type tricarboxylate transporter receptor subunit TctC
VASRVPFATAARVARALVVAIAACTFAVVAAAQGYPARTIRLIVAYPTGGISDVVGRALAERLSAQLGTPVIVENRAGAGGSIGIDAVAKAAPDGYTLAFAAVSPLTLNPLLGRTPYDPFADLVPVASVMFSPVVLLASPAFQGADFAALIAAAKAKPGAVRWATSGLATVGHVVLEQVKAGAGVDITHIPYKGGGAPLTDALGGQFEVMTTNMSATVLQQVRAGRLRALAVGAPRRLDALPAVPTFAELGYAKANLASTFGVFAPAKTPQAIVARLNTEIDGALRSPDLRERLAASDNVATGGTAAQFAQQIRAEYETNAAIVKAAGIRAE